MSSKRRIKRPNIWSTASIRLAAAFTLLFGLGGAILILALDYGMMRFAEAEVREGLEHQMMIMRADAERHGGVELVRELEAQPRNHDGRRYLFLVQAPDGSLFSNGLTRAAVNDSGYRRNLPTKQRPPRWPDQTPNMLVLSSMTSDGTLLAIGRDTEHLDGLRKGMLGAAIWSGLVLLALALSGGLLLGWLFLRRLEGVNRAVARIIAGDESERLPAIGFGREFDNLAAALNRMLDRQEASLLALKTMSEGVAHELRAPLNRLRNRLEEIETGEDGPARTAAVRQAAEEMDRLNTLFDSLLALARVGARAARLDLRNLDAGDLVRTVGEIYQPVVEEAGGALVQAPAPDGLTVTGDASLLQQAVSNLIENAVFHAGPAPQVEVAAARDGEEIVLSVADRGPGVPPEERAKVTRHFYRLDRSRTHPGSGLGLAMVQAVAEAHGGRLVLRDNAPGLRVEVRIPAAGDGG